MRSAADIDSSYYIDWQKVTDADVPAWLERFADAGAKRIVLGTNLLYRTLRSAEFRRMLTRELERLRLVLDGSHAPFSQAGLNMKESPEKDTVIRERLDMIRLCGDLGVKVLVNHLSCREEFYDVEAGVPELRRRAILALEKLLPQAERSGVTIALENIFFPSDGSAELLAITEYFASPHLGVCYDFGHANLIADRPGADPGRWPEKIRRVWNGRPVIWERNMLEKLLPQIVCLHMHDNNGFADQHLLPGKGNIDWAKLLPIAVSAPHLLSAETEVTVIAAGVDPAELCRTFRGLGFRS